MSKQSKLLLDSNELITLQTQLAVVVGDRAAIALQQIHYWCDVNQRQGKREHYQDDQWWVYNTWAEWQGNNFPFWSLSTVRRIFRDLEIIGVVITRAHTDQNKGFWITVNYGALEVLAKADGRTLKVRRLAKESAGGSVQFEQTGGVQNEQGGLSNLNRGSVQNEQPTRDTENTRERDSETQKMRAHETKKAPAVEQPSSKKVVADNAVKTPPPPNFAPPPAPKREAAKVYDDVPKADRLDMIRAWAGSLPIEPVNVYGREANHIAAAELFRDGYRPQQVAQFVKAKMQEDYWQSKTLTLAKVGELMPQWLMRLKPKSAPIPVDFTPLYPERERLTPEQIARRMEIKAQMLAEAR